MKASTKAPAQLKFRNLQRHTRFLYAKRDVSWYLTNALSCHIGANLCHPNNPCQNGGTCKSDGTNVICQCAPGYLGPHCERKNLAINAAINFIARIMHGDTTNSRVLDELSDC